VAWSGVLAATPWYIYPLLGALAIGFVFFYVWLARRSVRRTRALVAAPFVKRGLLPVVQTTWRNRYEGSYRGVRMSFDGEMSRGKYRRMVELDNRGVHVTKAGAKLNLANMFVQIVATLPAVAPGTLELVREPDDGLWELAPGLYGRCLPASEAALRAPGVLEAISAARVDRIAVSGTEVELAFGVGVMALMQEAQRNTPAEHEAQLERQLDAVAALAHALGA
jgi:hypothetical protein